MSRISEWMFVELLRCCKVDDNTQKKDTHGEKKIMIQMWIETYKIQNKNFHSNRLRILHNVHKLEDAMELMLIKFLVFIAFVARMNDWKQMIGNTNVFRSRLLYVYSWMFSKYE